jgi:dephospho-CoA kinase
VQSSDLCARRRRDTPREQASHAEIARKRDRFPVRMVVTVLRVGLTGGIGSGKSAVARLLAERGAVVVDADAIAREVVEPGTPGLAAVVAEFGSEVLTPDGALDRSRLGAIVFADPAARRRLNAIVHPLVGARSVELSATAAADAVVVHDVPLLAENGLAEGFDLVLVVESPESDRTARLRRERGMSEDEVRARMAAQASDAERRAIADVVIQNDSTLDDLADRVDAVWRERIAPLAAARAG